MKKSLLLLGLVSCCLLHSRDVDRLLALLKDVSGSGVPASTPAPAKSTSKASSDKMTPAGIKAACRVLGISNATKFMKKKLVNFSRSLETRQKKALIQAKNDKDAGLIDAAKLQQLEDKINKATEDLLSAKIIK